MVAQLQNTDDFEEWKTLFNQAVAIVNTVGDVGTLTTTQKNNLVAAVNELVTRMGSLAALTTTDKSSLVNAINELRTNINGLTIGEEVQAYSIILAGMAALISVPTGKILYTTGLNQFAAADISAYALTLLDDANAAAARTTLGLGSIAVLNAINNANWSGTPLSVANGGSGATTQDAARGNLGISYGKMALMIQAWN